jgi:hypothetical protein
VHALVCLTVQERQELDEIFPTYAPFPSHIPVARLRVLLQEYCALVGFEYGSRRVLVPITHSTGNVKAVNQLMAQDNKCCCCQMPYESYYERIYGCACRTSYTNAADWRQFLQDGADIITYAGIIEEVCKTLNQVHSLPQIFETLTLAKQAFADAMHLETTNGIPHPLMTRQSKARPAVSGAQDTLAIGKILEGDASANAFRFRLQGEDFLTHLRKHLNPLSKSRFDQLCVLLKRKNHDVLSLPLDLLYPRDPRVPVPDKMPGPMHCTLKTLKVELGLIQNAGVGSNPNGPSKRRDFAGTRGPCERLPNLILDLCSWSLCFEIWTFYGSRFWGASWLSGMLLTFEQRVECQASLSTSLQGKHASME